jgi:hypothetical protein
MSSSGTPESPGAGATPGVPEADDLTDEQREQLGQAAQQVAAIRAQLAAAPAELVVTNHVMGLYELAAVHLDQERPNLAAARLAIDALGAVLDACKGRLGDAEATLVGARGQIQLAFVAVSGRAAAPEADGAPAEAATEGEPPPQEGPAAKDES